MTRTKSTYLALVAVLLSPMAANADLLTFDGLTTNIAEDITSNNQGYGGLTWNTGNNWTLFDGGAYGVPTVSGDYGLVNNIGLDPNIVSSSSFFFNGVSIVGWYFNAPSQVGIRGYDGGNNLIGDTGFIGINTANYTFFNAGWAGVARLEFYGGQYFALDDMIINEVPEPGTLALLGIGLLGMGLARRRKV